MRDIGVGEQHQLGRGAVRLDMAQPFGDRPHLAGPPRRQRTGRDDGEAILAAKGGGARHRAGTVAAVIVDQHEGETPAIILAQQRGDGLADRRRLVARRDDGDDLGITKCRRRRDARPLAPEAAAAEEKIKPDRQR